MRILFITQLLPFPATTGGTTKTLKVLRALAKDHTVDVVTFHDSKDGIKRAKQLAALAKIRVFSYYRPETTRPSKMTWPIAFKSLFSIKPFRIYKYFDRRMVRKVGLLSKNTYFDCVYLDHDTSFQYLSLIHI